MPIKEVEDGNWHVLVYGRGAEKLRETSEPLNFNPNNWTLQQLGISFCSFVFIAAALRFCSILEK